MKKPLAILAIVALIALSLAISYDRAVRRGLIPNFAPDNTSVTVSPSSLNDTTRREHAAILASRLFTQHLVMKQYVEASQQGLDLLLSSRAEGMLTDPLTNQPYVYAFDQAAMTVGEVAFRVNATCDNKVTGSGGAGLIVDASASSVAVALRLESGGYVCETNL